MDTDLDNREFSNIGHIQRPVGHQAPGGDAWNLRDRDVKENNEGVVAQPQSSPSVAPSISMTSPSVFAGEADNDDGAYPNISRIMSNDTINIIDRHNGSQSIIAGGELELMQARIRSVGTYRQAREAIL